MVKSKDRSKWFGASDAKFICGNWNTKTFAYWWLIKLGWLKNNFKTQATMAGDNFEHAIAKTIGQIMGKQLVLDGQVKLKKYQLRINYDAESSRNNHEVKTYKLENGFEKVPRHYWLQCQVQMLGNNKKQRLWAYGLTEADYKNYFNEIDLERLKLFDIARDDEFIDNVLLPRLAVLKHCLKKGIFPKQEMLEGV